MNQQSKQGTYKLAVLQGLIKLLAKFPIISQFIMSANEPVASDDEFPLKKYLDSTRQIITKVKVFKFKRFLQGLIVFVSIIAAYFLLQITHQRRPYFQKMLKVKLERTETLAQVFFLMSLYLIFWNLVASFLKNKALQPPKKLDQYQELHHEQLQAVHTLPPLPNGEKYYHQIIKNSLNTTIYFFLSLLSILAYAYFDQQKRSNLPALVSIERVNFLGFWFLAGKLLTLLGEFLDKLTKMRQFRVLGISIIYLISILALGLANGINTFIFI